MKKPTVIGMLLTLTLGAFLVGRYSSRQGPAAEASSKRILYYVDPMHPAYRSSKPGIAPDCGMALIPVFEGHDIPDTAKMPSGAVSVSREKQELIGLRIATVENAAGSSVIHTTGRLEVEDNRLYRLTAATEGWVQNLQENSVGTVVKKDELLASFYSKEFRNAQQAYLGALTSSERVKTATTPDDPNSVLRTNEEQLRALGMGDPQIKDLARKHQTTREIAVVSPVDGIVLARNLSPAQRFEKGTELYRIADLSKMWIVADVFDDQARMLRAGSKVKVSVRELPRTLYATVTKNPPVFDPISRTLKLRLEVDNPGNMLRPDMFVDLEFIAKNPPGITVPAEAVLDSGLGKIVYVQIADNIFEPRGVELGANYGNRVAVRRGLSAGERIVSSGNFLLDSESRIRSNILHVSAGSKRTEGPNSSTGLLDDQVRK
jgi:membrane fusion protein, copper/silver efflux system